MGGARVIPIPFNHNYIFYRNILSKINGILFPGKRHAIDRIKSLENLIFLF